MNLQNNHLQGSFQGMTNYLKFDQIRPFLNILHNKLKIYNASSGVNLFNHTFFCFNYLRCNGKEEKWFYWSWINKSQCYKKNSK